MKSKLIFIINQVLTGKGNSEITDISSSTNLRTDLGFDSFDLAELTVRIEEEFGVDIFQNGIVNQYGDIEKLLN
jgi:acyl carrier protein